MICQSAKSSLTPVLTCVGESSHSLFSSYCVRVCVCVRCSASIERLLSYTCSIACALDQRERERRGDGSDMYLVPGFGLEGAAREFVDLTQQHACSRSLSKHMRESDAHSASSTALVELPLGTCCTACCCFFRLSCHSIEYLPCMFSSPPCLT